MDGHILVTMAYDVEQADRIRAAVQFEDGRTEKKMFGGLAFLFDGHMAVAATEGGGLLLRVDPAEIDSFINPPHVDYFEMRGQSMKGWLRVDREVIETDDALDDWVRRGIDYVRQLPAK